MKIKIRLATLSDLNKLMGIFRYRATLYAIYWNDRPVDTMDIHNVN